MYSAVSRHWLLRVLRDGSAYTGHFDGLSATVETLADDKSANDRRGLCYQFWRSLG